MTASTLSQDVSHVCELVRSQMNGLSRLIVGIAGPPASGKSTLADAVVSHLNSADGAPAMTATLLPMDGYHLDNSLLRSRGLLARKGAPETFDAHGFCQAVSSLQSVRAEMFFPCFDRDRDIAIANAICVGPDVDVVVVEGNYLLLQRAPWNLLKGLFAVTVFLSPGLDILTERLQARWIDHGLDPETALRRVTQNDLPNAELVIAHSAPAEIVLNQT